MKVTSAETADSPEAPSLQQRVRGELLRLRKLPTGLTVETMALSPTICGLLGAGDPYVAYTSLQHRLLEAVGSRELDALTASLGLSAEGDTHLKRLDAYGAHIHLDQRQVRRYSDKGVDMAVELITTNWPTQTVPQLTALVQYASGSASAEWHIQVFTRWLDVVAMRAPALTLMSGSTRKELEPHWAADQQDVWDTAATTEPLIITDSKEETSLILVWRGELWPKFNTQWLTPSPSMVSESLGNKLMLRLRTLDPP
jgi:hypothetical protein